LSAICRLHRGHRHSRSRAALRHSSKRFFHQGEVNIFAKTLQSPTELRTICLDDAHTSRPGARNSRLEACFIHDFNNLRILVTGWGCEQTDLPTNALCRQIYFLVRAGKFVCKTFPLWGIAQKFADKFAFLYVLALISNALKQFDVKRDRRVRSEPPILLASDAIFAIATPYRKGVALDL
jgi:hypothetical protein